MRTMLKLNKEAQTQIRMADVYEAIAEMEASGSPLMIPLNETLELLMKMAKERSNIHGDGSSGWLGEMVWLPNGESPIPATVIEYRETKFTQSILVKVGVGGHSRIKQLEVKEYGSTFFKNPYLAMERGEADATE